MAVHIPPGCKPSVVKSTGMMSPFSSRACSMLKPEQPCEIEVHASFGHMETDANPTSPAKGKMISFRNVRLCSAFSGKEFVMKISPESEIRIELILAKGM